ncbi:MAG: cytochrome c biogenesis protein CcsA [Alphaproteobacteria bacterium]
MTLVENPLLFSVLALFSLIPAAFVAWRRGAVRDSLFWSVTGLALIGPAAWCVAQLSGSWHTDLSSALWITVAASMALYAAMAVWTRAIWRLAPLLLPYLCVVALIATVWGQAPGRPLPSDTPATWVEVHIVFAVLTYSLLTISAVAGVAVLLQERALKTKRPTRLTALLPSVVEAESMQVRLLGATEIVLGFGLLTGVATQVVETGGVLEFNHKTVLSLVAFVVIGVLLAAHFRTGIRGRRASRLVLLAYLLLTLGYPGVKFVTDILLV